LSGWTMNAWSRFARQKVERVFTPISPLTAPFGRCRATRMKRRVCTSAPQQQQQRQARPAVAAALSAIWEQGILPALHSLLQHGSDTSTPDTVRIPQRPRLDASYDFGHRSRMPHAWVPCGYQTRTLATLLPTCVYKLHRSWLTCTVKHLPYRTEIPRSRACGWASPEGRCGKRRAPTCPPPIWQLHSKKKKLLVNQ